MESIEEQLARRDRVRRAMEQKRTPAERLIELFERRANAVDLRTLWPEGYGRFWRRNIRKRAIPTPPES